MGAEVSRGHHASSDGRGADPFQASLAAPGGLRVLGLWMSRCEPPHPGDILLTVFRASSLCAWLVQISPLASS